MIYKYGMRLRGFSIGCQPMNCLISFRDCKPGEKYHSILVYGRELSDEELQNYELDYLGNSND